MDGDVGALVKARDGDEDTRSDGKEVLGQGLDRAGESDPRTCHHRNVITDCPFKHVGQGQEGEEDVPRPRRYAVEHRLHGKEDIPVRKHHALGRSGRPGGIDDGGERIGIGDKAGADLSLIGQPADLNAQLHGQLSNLHFMIVSGRSSAGALIQLKQLPSERRSVFRLQRGNLDPCRTPLHALSKRGASWQDATFAGMIATTCFK